MNLEILRHHIETFQREVIESGFRRDVQDYMSTVSNNSNNIVILRDIAVKVLAALDTMYHGDLPAALSALMPAKSIRPFTEGKHDVSFRTLLQNSAIRQDQFYSQLHDLLEKLNSQLEQNTTEVNRIKTFVDPFLARETTALADANTAILSVAFKEERTITSLAQLTKTFQAWNRALPIYHQLLRSDSPEDIEIVEVQNGSVDLVIKLNVDVAVNLAQLVKIGLQGYAAYLSYKLLIKPITDTYRGNQKLLQAEEEREKVLLENIGTAVEEEVARQHDAAKKVDKDIHGTSVKRKIEEIAQLVTAHIVRGNDIKLLAVPQTDKQKAQMAVADDLRSTSADARSKLRELPPAARQKLIEAYSICPSEPEKKE